MKLFVIIMSYYYLKGLNQTAKHDSPATISPWHVISNNHITGNTQQFFQLWPPAKPVW